MMRQSKKRLLAAAVVGVPALVVSRHAMASAYVFTAGDTASPNLWADAGNWSLVSGAGSFPNALTDTATFGTNGAGDISLGGQPIQLQNLFYSTANSFNVGATTGDTLNFAAGGSIVATNGASQTISANITLNSGTFVLSLKPAAGNVFDLKGAITGATFIQMIGASANGAYQFDGANTYSGGTLMSNGNVFRIGVSSTFDAGGNITSGALGTGTVAANTRPQFMAVNADQTLGNALLIGGAQSGMIVTNAAGTAFNMTFTGPITNNPTNKLFFDLYTPGKTTTLGAAGTSATWTLSSGSGGNQTQIDLAGSNGGSVSTLVLNYIIQDPAGGGAGLAFNNTGIASGNTTNGANTGGFNAYTVLVNGASTYSSGLQNGIGTQFNGSNAIYQIGLSSAGGIGTNATSGPFGIGSMQPHNSGSPPTFQPHGGNRILNNALDLTQGAFAVSNDSSGAFSLTFAGPVTLNSGRSISNNLSPGASLSFGTATNPQPWTLGTGTGSASVQFRTQNNSTSSTFVYDSLTNGASNIASVSITSGGPVYLMANNTYTGGTTVNGAGTSAAAVGTGGTLAGTGTVGGGGVVTLSGTSSGSLGGIVSPGAAPASAGTLNVPGMAWNPFGRYVFEFNGNDTTVGSGINDLIAGAGSLDLTNLSAATPFDLNLQSLVANTGANETYTLATFAAGVLANGASLDAQDITSDFTFSGNFTGTPDVTVSGNNLLLTLNQTAVPEPSAVLLAAASAGLLGFRGRRRRRK